MKPERIDKVIHERVRLGIMSALAARGSLTFGELKEILEVTDGNLSVHSSVLEDKGLIKVKKEFEGRKPRTTFSITQKGRKAFADYVDQIERMIRPGSGEG